MKLNWISVKDEMPEENRDLLIVYNKTGKNSYRQKGKTGTFITQGVLRYHDFYKTYIWYDYTDRQIQDLSAKHSKNLVTHWIYISELSI